MLHYLIDNYILSFIYIYNNIIFQNLHYISSKSSRIIKIQLLRLYENPVPIISVITV